jgi:hypothetical protein
VNVTDEPRSFELKLSRSRRHLRELEVAIESYAETHPYKVVPHEDNTVHPLKRTFYAFVNQPPDPALSIILGDVLYNLRSALDHLAVALVAPKRRRRASFPIFVDDLWATDPASGSYVNADDHARQAFDTATKTMSDEALDVIRSLQPFRTHPHAPEKSPLAVLNRLSSADKHSRLVPVSFGIADIEFSVVTDGVQSATGRVEGFFEYGTEVSCELPTSQAGAYMEMTLRGTARVAFEVGDQEQHLRAPDGVSKLIETIKDRVVDRLVPLLPPDY